MPKSDAPAAESVLPVRGGFGPDAENVTGVSGPHVKGRLPAAAGSLPFLLSKTRPANTGAKCRRPPSPMGGETGERGPLPVPQEEGRFPQTPRGKQPKPSGVSAVLSGVPGLWHPPRAPAFFDGPVLPFSSGRQQPPSARQGPPRKRRRHAARGGDSRVSRRPLGGPGNPAYPGYPGYPWKPWKPEKLGQHGQHGQRGNPENPAG